MALTKEEKQLLKIYNKTDDEKIKKVLGVLLDEEEAEEVQEEVQEEKEEVKEVAKEKVEEKEKPKEEPQKKEIPEWFKEFQEDFKTVLGKVKELDEKKEQQFGVKAKPKTGKETNTFDDVFNKLTQNQ